MLDIYNLNECIKDITNIDSIDKNIRPFVKVLNLVPNIKVVHCCYGYGIKPYTIWFKVSDWDTMLLFCKSCFNNALAWKIRFLNLDTNSDLIFGIEFAEFGQCVLLNTVKSTIRVIGKYLNIDISAYINDIDNILEGFSKRTISNIKIECYDFKNGSSIKKNWVSEICKECGVSYEEKPFIGNGKSPLICMTSENETITSFTGYKSKHTIEKWLSFNVYDLSTKYNSYNDNIVDVLWVDEQF